MAITVGNTSNNSTASGSQLTWGHNSDTDFLVICVKLNGSSTDISSVTYDGVTMTEAVATDDTVRHSSIYYLASPSSGSNTVQITVSGSGHVIAGSAVSLDGVHTSAPLGNTNSGTGTTTSLALTGVAAGDIAVDCLCLNHSSTLPNHGTGQTSLQRETVSGNIRALSSYELGETSMSYDSAGSGCAYTAAVFESAVEPTVSTGTVKDLFETTGTIDTSNASDDGGSAITERGVVVDTATAPEITDTKFTSGSGTGTYNTSMTSLSDDTHYYCRAYATNAVGTAYGSEIEFDTDEDAAKPIIQLDNPITFS